MRILHVNMAYSGGGLEQYLLQVFVELENRGHKNLFLYGEADGGPQCAYRADTFFVENVTHLHCPDLPAKLKRVQRILDDQTPDLVFIHQVLNPSLIGLLTKQKPSVLYMHGFKIVCPDGRKTLQTKGEACPFPLSRRCQTRAYCYRCMPRNPLVGMPLISNSKCLGDVHRQRSPIVVASGFMKKVLLYNGFGADSISVIPYFTYLPEPDVPRPSGQEQLILALGRLVPEKGMHHLIRAFSRIHPPFKLAVVGDGPALPSLKQLSQELGISTGLHFSGWLPHDKLEALYRQCRIVVVPSVWPEPFGIVGIEAMAYAKPVIAFDVGGVSEWLSDGRTGFLVRPKDEGDLLDKMVFLLEHSESCSAMGLEGRMEVEKRFTPDSHLDLLLSLFRKTIQAFGSRVAK